MSLFSWLTGGRKAGYQASAMPSSGLSRMDSTKPFHAAKLAGGAQPANRKQERMARRELLYSVVRESMVRSGVLSTSYKFKVLSLDARGRQFLVMVDLAQGAGGETTRLAEIEAMIAQSAKFRHDIVVTAVYWRSNEHVAVGVPPPRKDGVAEPRREPAVSSPAPLSEQVSRPAELREAPPEPRRVEPVQADEVAAFKRALSAGTRGEQALAAAAARGGAHSYTLLTGFEDTEMVETQAEGGGAEHLSGTQYGELR